MSSKRYLIVPVLAVALVVGVRGWELASGVPAEARPPAAGDASAAGTYHELGLPGDAAAVGAVGLGAAASDTAGIDRRIEFWRERAEAQHSATAWTYIGDLFDAKARLTADASHYNAARDAYETALEIAPGTTEARAGLARILATLHEFAAAVEEAATVLEADPTATGALGVIFDASLELGDLDNANRALALLQERVDGAAVRVRQARLAFLSGKPAEAVTLARQAAAEAQAAGEDPASICFYEYAAAEYQLLAGDLDGASAGYAAALSALPGYPLALAGEGRVAFLRGDHATAIARYEAAVAAIPRPDFVAYLGDLYAIVGDEARANDQYALVEFAGNLGAEAAGRIYDREYATFLADHGRDTARAVAMTRAERETRRDAHGHDALAWALFADGQTAEALAASQEALESGVVDARLLAHAGLIEMANGLAAEGEAHLRQALGLGSSLSPLVVERMREAVGQ